MNELIRKFAEQAGGHNDISKFCGHFLPPAPGYIDPATVDLKKFVELIVRECIRLNKTQLASIPDDQKDWDGHNYGMTAAVYGFEDLVKEHFGVENE